jgi:hypothetical protein
MDLKNGLKAIKALLTGVKLDFAQQPLVNGSLIQYAGDEIEKDEVVYITTGEGNWSVLPDGEYKTRKGDTFTITNGTVSDVKVEPDPVEDDDKKKPVKQAQAKAEDKDKKPAYGNVEYADPGFQTDKKARYPIDTEEHIRAAWNYIHKSKNESQYNPDDLKKVKGAIETAWRKKISADGPPEGSKHEDMDEDGSLIGMSKQTLDGYDDIDNTGSGDDVDAAGSPETFDDEDTPAPAVATVDVGDLVDAKLQPILQQICDLQTLLNALQEVCTSQKTTMSAISSVVNQLANEPAGKPIVEEVDSPKPVDKNLPKSVQILRS